MTMSLEFLPSAAPQSSLALARITPRGKAAISGLRASFAELPALAAHLEAERFDGYILEHLNDAVSSLALVFEGHLVAASAIGDKGTVWGSAALTHLAQRYALGATLHIRSLERSVVHALTGLGDRPWKAQPADGFTGIRVQPEGQVILQFEGLAVAHLHTNNLEPGAFPAPLRPPRLSLPRLVGPWASERYALTLRGRDAINPITPHYQRLRATHGKQGVETLTQLGRGKTPLEVAQTLERDVFDLEEPVAALVREGLLSRRQDPV